MSDRERDIVDHDVEPRRPPYQIIPHHLRHILSLRDQLTRIELRHDTLQHLVHDTRQHPLVVVLAERPVNLWQGIDARARENTAGNVDHLEILGAGERGNTAGFGADVVVDGRLEPGNADVGALGEDLFGDAADARVFDGAVTSVDCGSISVLP
jgi:hypothetical protein